MRHFLLRLALPSMAALMAILAWQAPLQAADWPPQPSRLYLSTPQGLLRIVTSEYVYDAQLQLDGKDVQPSIRGLLNITYAFKTEHSTAALLSINTGNSPCDIHYRWILLERDGYQLSPQFGSCSDRIRVDADERGYTLITPNPQASDLLDVYHYDGRQLTQAQQAASDERPLAAPSPPPS